jgi:putative transposase
MTRMIKGRPPRLAQVFQGFGNPLYFITFNTLHHQPLLANDSVHHAFIRYAERGKGFGVGVGRYVLMPDHVHLFVRPGPEVTLVRWCSGLKRALSAAMRAGEHERTEVWQPGFFDHVLRDSESYAEKWLYVRDNPVRKKLSLCAEDWPYQGEIVRIERA